MFSLFCHASMKDQRTDMTIIVAYGVWRILNFFLSLRTFNWQNRKIRRLHTHSSSWVTQVIFRVILHTEFAAATIIYFEQIKQIKKTSRNESSFFFCKIHSPLYPLAREQGRIHGYPSRVRLGRGSDRKGNQGILAGAVR